ncbi:MAG: hypothetical protein GAK28_04571 [Luteibacter sp.]|uniref:hypothetical protein n=1 Tax=Luteibacter sp. TaxID=1886636 RepID=UPI001381786B|nr:hypothetical protein [Luteibacter sp.]KAF1003592.1 MAG: hypothetical protein GAK28_04571 [Luteibacter sp.]
MNQSKLAAVTDGQLPFRGLPIGDLRGFGRVRADAALACLAIDREAGTLRASHDERDLISLHLDGDVDWQQAYVPGTNVLETTGHLDGAELRVADFMPLAEGRSGQAIAKGRFVRIVTCTEGHVAFRLVCAAGIDGRPANTARTTQGWHVACSHPMGVGADVAATMVTLTEGESLVLVISNDAVEGGPALLADALHGLGDTIHYWSWWSDRCRYRGDDAEARLREALSIKLSCGDHGMLVEEPGERAFAPAPLSDVARAAALFLDLGYRMECAQLLAQVDAASQCDAFGRRPSEGVHLDTLGRYLARYGRAGLPVSITLPDDEPLRAAR